MVDVEINIQPGSNLPDEMEAIGEGIELLHDDTSLLIEHLDIDSSERPVRFRLEGVVMDP